MRAGLPEATIPLLKRVVAFFGIFVLASGLIGPRIISGGILYRDGFAIYGGLGKAVLFGLIVYALLIRHKGVIPRLETWHPKLLGWMGASMVMYALAWISVSHLLAGERTVANLAVAHIGLILSMASAALCCFGLRTMRQLYGAYKREGGVALGITALFYGFLISVYALWRPLATIVLHGVQGLLALSGIPSELSPPFTLLFDKFGVTVAQTCSGIESIALFTGLYIIVGLIDWPRLNRKRYFGIFPLALGLLCLLNIMRVYTLIMAGYFINPQIAFSLFHTYAGLVFFVLYSVVFWAIAYKYLLKQPEAK